jgi:hypothetical protein
MSDFEIDFEWPLAPKYEFRPATAEELRQLHEYDISRIPEADRPFVFGEIIPTGQSKNQRPKAAAMERAVRMLVECKDTSLLHTVALKLAGTLGLVGGERDTYKEKFGKPYDHVLDWYRVARRLRLMFEGKYNRGEDRIWPDPVAQYQGDLGFFLVPDRGNRPVLKLRPHTFGDALILYAARMIAAGTTLNHCKNCNGPFLSGGSRERRKKRADATFCSDECRWKYHNEARRKARIGG